MYGIIGWTVALVFFVILEAATVGVVSIWFAGGAAAALICAALGLSFGVQAAAFLLLSAVLLMLLRPMVRRLVEPRRVATNADRAIGQEALVTETIDRLRSRGAVKLGGIEWSARTDGDEIIEKGCLVRVLRIEGAYVCVERISDAKPAEPAAQGKQ